MEGEVKYAGFWIRVLANILDCAIWVAGMFIVRYFFLTEATIPDLSKIFESVEDFSQFSQAWIGIWKSAMAANMVNIIGSITWFVYLVVMIGRFGATLGKMAVGIRVVRDDLQPVSYGIALVREVLIKGILFVVICFISWLGYLWVTWDPKKQGWHDKIARTIVIKES